MPTIECNKNDLNKLLGKNYSIEELKELVLYAIAEIDSEEEDLLKIDVKTSNRPDLWSVEGIAREIKGRLGEKGIPKIEIKPSGKEIKVEKNVEKIRPYIVGAIAKNIEITEELLIQLIQLQEKVATTFGRKRTQTAIGIYDYDKIVWPIEYKAIEPESIEFIPLEYNAPLNLEQILEKHPKGKEYANILKNFHKYPIITDANKEVVSFPPIINSQKSGKITTQTKNLFIEITGTIEEDINTAINVMTQALSDRGAEIESVKINYENIKKTSPKFITKKIELTLEEINELSGLELTQKNAIDLLEKGRHSVQENGKKIIVSYPAYRQDILHSVDIIEDAIISYDYNKIKPEMLKAFTIGKETNETKQTEIAREICIGLGLQEILSFTLTGKENQETKLGLKEEEFVEIANPMNSSLNIMRKRITPELLKFLASNQHTTFPQKIFEIGKCLTIDSKQETKVKETQTLCIMLSHTKTDFTQIKSQLEGFCSNFGIEYELEEKTEKFLKKGRSAKIKTKKGKGFLGEIKPEILGNYGIKNKITVLEIPIM